MQKYKTSTQKYKEWLWLYGSWIYNYLCNQCLSVLVLTLWVWIPLRRGVLSITICDKVCQWLVADWWVSLGTPVSSTNKTDRQVVESDVKHHNPNPTKYRVILHSSYVILNIQYTYIVGKYIFHLHSLPNRTEKLAKGSLFYLFLKHVQWMLYVPTM